MIAKSSLHEACRSSPDAVRNQNGSSSWSCGPIHASFTGLCQLTQRPRVTSSTRGWQAARGGTPRGRGDGEGTRDCCCRLSPMPCGHAMRPCHAAMAPPHTYLAQHGVVDVAPEGVRAARGVVARERHPAAGDRHVVARRIHLALQPERLAPCADVTLSCRRVCCVRACAWRRTCQLGQSAPGVQSRNKRGATASRAAAAASAAPAGARRHDLI
jgi:hypothetical protein